MPNISIVTQKPLARRKSALAFYHHASKREKGFNHEVLRAKLIGCIASNPWPYGEEGADDTTADSSIASAASQVAVPTLPPLPPSSLP